MGFHAYVNMTGTIFEKGLRPQCVLSVVTSAYGFANTWTNIYVCSHLSASALPPYHKPPPITAAVYLNIKATVWSMQHPSAKISLCLTWKTLKDGILFCWNYSLCLIWQEYKQEHKWDCFWLTEQWCCWLLTGTTRNCVQKIINK